MDGTGRVVKENIQSHSTASNEDDRDASNNIPYLDEGMLTQIFTRTAIESLFSELRYACKSWFDIITNNPVLHHNHHHLCQQPRFLAQYEIPLYSESYSRHRKSLTEHERSVDEFKKQILPCLTYLFKLGEEGSIEEQVDLTPLFRKYLYIMSCCNGLMLVHRKLNASLASTLYVVNILTKQRLVLPPAPKTWNQETCALVFIPSSGDYKVVLHAKRDGLGNGVEILTLPTAAAGGCTSSLTTHEDDLLRWRFVKAPVEFVGELPPLAINGILYWVHHTHYLVSHNLRFILSFDATTESFHGIPNPEVDSTDTNPPRVNSQQRAGFLELGGCLSLVSSRPYFSSEQNKLDIWVFKQDNREWIKQSTLDIDNKLLKCEMEDNSGYRRLRVKDSYEPILSFKSGQVIILSRYRGGRHPPLAYNVTTKRLWELKITGDLDLGYFGLEFEQSMELRMRFYDSHVSSIVPFKSLFKNFV